MFSLFNANFKNLKQYEMAYLWEIFDIHILYINCLVCASVCRGPKMSHTWPETFQRQVRFMVAERHTLTESFVSPHRQSVCDKNDIPK
jgi:hypothetical protein